MSVEPNADVLAAIQAGGLATNEDRLLALRNAVANVRDLEKLKIDQEAALKETNIKLQEAYYKTLPDLMDQVGVPSITLASEGNLPEVVAKAQPYYHASISAEWPIEQQYKAFKYLEDTGHGDLIKTGVTINFPREEHDKALAFARKMRDAGFTVEEKQSVHFKTLTAWLKEMIEKRKVMPDLDIIGGTVGRVVKLSKDK